MTCHTVSLLKRRNLKNGYHSLLFGDFPKAKKCRPGQFLHVKVPSCNIFFRRAFSIATADPEQRTIEIILKVFGRGSGHLSGLRKGDEVDLLGPLGQSFRMPGKKEHALIVAGGVGFPPLLYLAQTMVAKGYDARQIHFFYGGRTAADIIERSRIRKLGVDFRPVTEDGSYGDRGLVLAPVAKFIDEHRQAKMRIFSCGPEGLLRATDSLGREQGIPGQVSLEAPMPCGIGVCLGCVVPLRAGGYARVCHDGPVFEIGEVVL